MLKKRNSWLMFVDLPPSSLPRWWIINAFKIGLLFKIVPPFDLSKNRKQKHISYKMSKDDVAISGGKSCASKTKSYARKITCKFWPLRTYILVELGSKKCTQCFEDSPRLSWLGYKLFVGYWRWQKWLSKMLGTLDGRVVDGIWEKTLGICAFFTLPEYTV